MEILEIIGSAICIRRRIVILIPPETPLPDIRFPAPAVKPPTVLVSPGRILMPLPALPSAPLPSGPVPMKLPTIRLKPASKTRAVLVIRIPSPLLAEIRLRVPGVVPPIRLNDASSIQLNQGNPREAGFGRAVDIHRGRNLRERR